jgi:uncharacterized damage-inducible protein DinB
MLEMIRALYHHMAWADMQMLAAIGAHPAAAEDEEMRRTLHHIVGVQRFFLSQLQNRGFDLETEKLVPSTHEAMERLFRETHAQELTYIDSVDAAALLPVMESGPFANIRPTAGEMMIQAVMHSQHHRGQCASRLRVLGGKAPTVDFILWLKDRP